MQAVALVRRLAPRLAALSLSLPVAAQALFDPLIGVVTSPDGAPVAGATVQALRAGGRGTCLLDRAYRDDFRPVATMVTDRAGRFALQLPIGLPCRVVVDHAPYARWQRDDCMPSVGFEVRLQPPAVMHGRITRHDGAPANAALRVWERATGREVGAGATDERGRYRLERLAPGQHSVEITPTDAPSPAWFDFELAAGATFEHDVELREGALVAGRVLDAETGEPIAGARIGEGWTMHRAVTTDARGVFELPGGGSSGRPHLNCQAAGFVKQVRAEATLAAGGPVDFHLVRGLRADGRVVDAQGRGVLGAYVQAFGYALDGNTSYHDLVATRTDEDGAFALGGLSANTAHALVVRKDGYGMAVLAMPRPDGHTYKMGRVELGRPCLVRGTLHALDGAPVTAAEVRLVGYNADRHAHDPDGALARGAQTDYDGWGLLDHYLGQRKVRSDHLGAFAFGDVAPGTYRVVVIDRATGVLHDGAPFVVTHEQPCAPLELVASR